VARDLALLFVLERISRPVAALFENPGAAKYALQVFLNVNGKMDDSIRAVENQTSVEELKSFRRGAGHV
jgi:hypothetical protein